MNCYSSKAEMQVLVRRQSSLNLMSCNFLMKILTHTQELTQLEIMWCIILCTNYPDITYLCQHCIIFLLQKNGEIHNLRLLVYKSVILLSIHRSRVYSRLLKKRPTRHHGLWSLVLLSYSHLVYTSMTILHCPSVVTDTNGQSSFVR